MKEILRYNEGLNENIKLIQAQTKESANKIKQFIFNEVDPYNLLLPGETIKRGYFLSKILINKI